MKKINVLYTLDHLYVKYMLVSLYSLLDHNQNLDIDVHIICDSFDDNDYKMIESVVSNFKNANVYYYSFDNIEKMIDSYGILPWKDKKIPNARLFFNECIKDVDKLLYLDSDTIVVGSLENIDQYNNGPINMVLDIMPKDYWQNIGNGLNRYCNSGVIYFDVNEWNKQKCEDKILSTLEKDIVYTYPDQDILNIALQDEMGILPPNYNLFAIDYYFNMYMLNRFYNSSGYERYDFDAIKDAKTNPIVLHSIPFYRWKGWEKNSIHPYTKYYMEYLDKLRLDLDEDHSGLHINPSIYKFYLYSKLMCPKNIKEGIKGIARTLK